MHVSGRQSVVVGRLLKMEQSKMDKSANSANFKEKVVLINIGREWREGLTPDQLYERARRYWHCNPSNHDAEYAVSVARGVVREIYRIEGWDPVDLRTEKIDPSRLMNTPPPKILDRWAFRGATCRRNGSLFGRRRQPLPTARQRISTDLVELRESQTGGNRRLTPG